MSEKSLPEILVLTGPTATGKTKIGIELAQKLNGEIISADSRQVYKLMDIGTAKPTPQERKEAVHHLLDVVFPDETYSAGRFAREAEIIIEQILNRQKLPIIVGGTGLYLKSLIYGIFESPRVKEEIRKELRQEAEHYGLQNIYERLADIDPLTAGRISPKDRVRIIRALEIYEVTGRPISELQTQWKKKQKKYEFKTYGIIMNRKKLYERINSRVDRMIEQGFLGEVKNLKQQGYSFELPALRTFGYLDFFNYLQGKVGLGEAIEKFKQGTRNFAKRQLTWFRHQLPLTWIDLDNQKPVEVILRAFESN